MGKEIKLQIFYLWVKRIRYKLFVGTFPTVLKRIVCCHENHAFSHSSNGVIFRAILLPIAGGPKNNLTPMRSCPEDARLA